MCRALLVYASTFFFFLIRKENLILSKRYDDDDDDDENLVVGVKMKNDVNGKLNEMKYERSVGARE